jgi:hypothetical protein
MNLQVPSITGKFLSSSTIGGFSKRAQLQDDDKFLKYILFDLYLYRICVFIYYKIFVKVCN